MGGGEFPILDAILVLVVLLELALGWLRGLLASVFGLVGLVAGAIAGTLLVGQLPWTDLVAARGATALGLLPLLIVVLCAAFAQQVGLAVGRSARRRLFRRSRHGSGHRWRLPGAAVSGLLTLGLMWLVVLPLRGVGLGPLSQEIADSRVLHAVDRYVPDRARVAAAPLHRRVSREGIATVAVGVGLERIRPVDPPNPRIRGAVRISAVSGAVVKVRSMSRECSGGSEGSGFVARTGFVVTNAHVVAGGRRVTVTTREGQVWPAEVVSFDPRQDIAVVRVAGLRQQPLRKGLEPVRGADAAVAGYPLDGPYSVRPARVREVSEDVGTDIYGSVGPTRRTLVLRSRLDEGNSGGPLFNAYGEVVGLIFARSLEDRETGYAMTLDRVYPMVDGLGPRAAAVGTGPCLPGQQDDWG